MRQACAGLQGAGWFLGKVASIQPNRVCTVVYDDGFEEKLPRAQVRRQPLARPPRPHPVFCSADSSPAPRLLPLPVQLAQLLLPPAPVTQISEADLERLKKKKQLQKNSKGLSGPKKIFVRSGRQQNRLSTSGGARPRAEQKKGRNTHDCRSCGATVGRDGFSGSQWRKRRAREQTGGKCLTCMDAAKPSPTAVLGAPASVESDSVPFIADTESDGDLSTDEEDAPGVDAAPVAAAPPAGVDGWQELRTTADSVGGGAFVYYCAARATTFPLAVCFHSRPPLSCLS
jgi:hypothetical protein